MEDPWSFIWALSLKKNVLKLRGGLAFGEGLYKKNLSFAPSAKTVKMYLYSAYVCKKNMSKSVIIGSFMICFGFVTIFSHSSTLNLF